MRKMRVLTCGDANYFFFLTVFEKNIYNICGEYPIIYDIGLTYEQRNALNSKIVDTTVPDAFREYTKSGNIRTIHKPYCVRHFMDNWVEDCLYLDADILLLSKIDHDMFQGFDLAVTPRHPKERKSSMFANGLLNAGVIFFANDPKVKGFLSRWQDECLKDNKSDQMALSDLLSDQVDLLNGPEDQQCDELAIRLLNPEIYNDVACKTGKVFHFKNAGRSEGAKAKYLRFARFQSAMPNFVNMAVAINRRMRIFTSRPPR